MRKKLLALLMAVALLCSVMALPAAAEEGTDTEVQTTSGEGSGSTESSGECKHVWVVSKSVPASCSAAGYKEYTCSACGAAGKEEIAMVAHTYDNGCDTECNVCGASREAVHTPSIVWSKNSRKHWYPCTVCGAQTNVADHYPGPAATEERDQFCLTCGLLMTPKLTHTHSYPETMATDTAGHWYACESCGEKSEYGNHSFDNSCDPDCDVCGYTVETSHSFDGEWHTDETNHWLTCINCGEMGEAVAHVAGTVAEGEAQPCIVCGYQLAPGETHVHEAGTEWMKDEDGHWHECGCGEKLDAAQHSWDQGTEAEDGSITYVCTECQTEKTEVEPQETEEPEQDDEELPVGILTAILAVILVCVLVLLFLLLRGGRKTGKYHKRK